MKKDAKKMVHTPGSRKKAIARATLSPGTGMVRINRVKLDHYGSHMCRQRIMEPLILAGDTAKEVNIAVSVHGGGNTTQADAIRLAIARALNEHTKDKLKTAFLEYDRTLLVADVRRKEKRKPNCAGSARSKTQKSYR